MEIYQVRTDSFGGKNAGEYCLEYGEGFVRQETIRLLLKKAIIEEVYPGQRLECFRLTSLDETDDGE